MIQINLLLLTLVIFLIGFYYKKKNDNMEVKLATGFDYDRIFRTIKRLKRYSENKGRRPAQEDIDELKRYIKRKAFEGDEEFVGLKDQILTFNALDDDNFLCSMISDDVEDKKSNRNKKEENNMYYRDYRNSMDRDIEDSWKAKSHPDIIASRRLERANNDDSIPNSIKGVFTILNHEHYTCDPAVGREKEIKALMRAILTPERSALLVGEPGVGKTSIIKGLAYRIKCGNVPDALKSYTIFETSASKLNGGCSLNGMLERRTTELFEYLKKQHNAILFVDELHTFIGTGRGTEHESLDIANIIKPYLSNGDVIMVGATTKCEYDEYIREDAAFKERFKIVKVDEPDDKSLKVIVDHTIDKYCNEYNLTIDKNYKTDLVDHLVYCTRKERRNINDFTCNPRLVIGVIAEAVAEALLNSTKEIKDEYIKEAYNNNIHLTGHYSSIKQPIIRKNESNVISLLDFKKNIGC